MSRKTKEVTITAKGRDKGKKFSLTEMACRPADKWAIRAMMAIAKNGIEIPDIDMDQVREAGMAGLAGVVAKAGFGALLKANFDEIEPLLDEMMLCVEIKEAAATRPLTEDDIEEVATLYTLRREILGLHWDFFSQGDK